MPVVPRIHEDHLELILDGDFTFGEVKRTGSRALESDKLVHPVKLLLDYSGAAGLGQKKAENLKETAEFFASRSGEVSRVAILAPSDLAFGLMRMAAAHASDGGFLVSVFRSKAEARAWLALSDEDAAEIPE